MLILVFSLRGLHFAASQCETEFDVVVTCMGGQIEQRAGHNLNPLPRWTLKRLRVVHVPCAVLADKMATAAAGGVFRYVSHLLCGSLQSTNRRLVSVIGRRRRD